MFELMVMRGLLTLIVGGIAVRRLKKNQNVTARASFLRMDAMVPGCVKAEVGNVFRGPLTIPEPPTVENAAAFANLGALSKIGLVACPLNQATRRMFLRLAMLTTQPNGPNPAKNIA